MILIRSLKIDQRERAVTIMNKLSRHGPLWVIFKHAGGISLN